MSIERILELGWIKSDNDLVLARQLAADAEGYAANTQSEADTIAVFVEPILRGLGWGTLTTKEVSRESRRSYPLGDLWLLAENGTKIAVIIEVKQIGQRNWEDEGPKQLEVYVYRLVKARKGDPQDNWKWRIEDGSGTVFLRGVLTNGKKWNVYDFKIEKAGTEAASISPEPRCQFDLSNDKEGWSKFLSEIGKDEIDRKVKAFRG